MASHRAERCSEGAAGRKLTTHTKKDTRSGKPRGATAAAVFCSPLLLLLFVFRRRNVDPIVRNYTAGGQIQKCWPSPFRLLNRDPPQPV